MNDQPKNRISFAQESDQRYLPRWEVKNRIKFQIDGSHEAHEAVTRDIHASGLCFSSELDLNLDQNLNLSVYLDENLRADVKGKIAWHKNELGSKVYGIEFFDMDNDTQDLILDEAFKLERKKFFRDLYYSKKS